MVHVGGLWTVDSPSLFKIKPQYSTVKPVYNDHHSRPSNIARNNNYLFLLGHYVLAYFIYLFGHSPILVGQYRLIQVIIL